MKAAGKSAPLSIREESRLADFPDSIRNDSDTLSWGREKIIAIISERVGSAIQEFVIRSR